VSNRICPFVIDEKYQDVSDVPECTEEFKTL
jgi:hypothetical protein